MFHLSEKFEIHKRFLKCDYIRYSPRGISTIKTPNSQISIKIPREHSVISLLNSYLELNFDVLHAATNNRYADFNDIRLINLGVIALFSFYKLATSSGKRLEDINHAHIVSLMYKLLSSSKESNDLSIGFDCNRDRRKREITNNKNIKGEFHLRIHLGDFFGFAEQQERGTYGLGFKLTFTRNIDSAVLNDDNAVNNAKIKIIALEWYAPHYTASMDQQTNLFKQIKDKTHTQLHYLERSLFTKEVNTQKFWNFELGVQENVSVPIWIFVVFQQSDRQHDQNLNNDTFVRLPVISIQVVIGTERYPDTAILLN